METARLKPEQTKSEPASDRSQKSLTPVTTSSHSALTVGDAHPPAMRLDQAFGGAHAVLPAIQTKLTVNEPGDQYEQEADRVADQVMRMPASTLHLQRKCGCGGTGTECAECAAQEPRLQRRAASLAETSTPVPAIVEDVLSAPGHALDGATRTFMETRFRANFDGVRVHADARAAESARAVNALAYTVGSNMVFGAGQYAPGLDQGKRLIAHELAHVIQQAPKPAAGVGSTNFIGSAPRLARKTGDYADSKAMVLEELNRKMPVAIFSMLDKLDPETRDRLGLDPDFTDAAAKLPPASRGLVYKHLAMATDESSTDRKARLMLLYIKSEARQRATAPKTVKTDTMFYKRLTDFYLKDYLAKPTAQSGTAAAEKISKPFTGEPDKKDVWEGAAAGDFSKQPIPEMFQKLRPNLPPNVAAGTDILSLENRKKLPYVDVDPLLGKPNVSTEGLDSDIKGGKNISHLLHWATGVKFSDPNAKLDRKTLRELFLAYELWHLEAWDVFGEDPLNDLIVEEAGRILGTQLRSGTIDQGNLQEKLNLGFAEARAWVGSLLCMRQAEFDDWILAKTQKKANVWWGKRQLDVWGPETIHARLARGYTIEEVKEWELTQRIIEIYSLIYEAELWKKSHGPIENTLLTQKLAEGKMDKPIEKVAKGQDVKPLELAGDLGLGNLFALLGGDAPDTPCD